ncbi:pcrA: ATP-dependent DNA helicase PcrA [Rubrobacter radiotolerans]|uniref:ATP-dependent DNA helicase n=1 Tax=Rubrobacter radiotolerans TaxID=42256 RepID=A0A023X0J7_RUBRA|nr:DNA helicase PcrA [Rubrobacter radiotolerans]AHY45997.1 pcrA: ATP-dependent DNA helicase PcrA [Rubrobacter radiotolerans]MDX5893409.1 DNA helicase PcrA [Rubrobacter radiotolerans]SMC03672.1 DNA helicase-2 / ATP-dependent DNA helicase PcrA [Rubrobacter radiotolerans DSM 5868]
MLTDSLNESQREAVLHTEGPLLILAGAGSGKTRVLTHRIAHILDSGLAAPDEILAITFTNKAAAEMKERVALLVGPESRKMWVSTFHAFCARILRVHAEKLGYKREFTIYDSADQVRLVKRCIVELGKDPKRFNPRSFQAQISDAKNRLMDAGDYLKATEGYMAENVAEVYDLYQQRLYENNAMDFDDLIMQTVALLELFPEVRERYGRRFRYIHVDEYQDTNHAQYRLVTVLAQAHGNLCVVGDDDQSVYSWRGADIRNILDFERDYPQAKVVRLEQNYRSTQTILSAANAVVANNASRKPKALWTAGEDGERIKVFTASDEYAEARYVVSEIERLTESGARPTDVAVFYRTNAQSRALEDVLVREGVPYQIVGGVRFYERAEIKDAMAYLAVIANPQDDVSLERIINVPKRGVGATSVGKLQQHARANESSMYEALDEAAEAGISGKAQKACGELKRLFEGWRVAARELTPAETIGAVLDESGYRRELEAENTVEAEARLENLAELVNAAAEYERAARESGEEPTLEGFLQEQALYSEQDNLGGGRVTLMTLHNAKGLEYPHVFIVGMEEGTFPHARSLDEQNLEEERRLCYVGITRAMETLTLTYAKLRSSWGGEREYQMPSRFLAEIPDEYKSGSAPAFGGGAGAFSGGSSGGSRFQSGRMRSRSSVGPTSSMSSTASATENPYTVGDKVRHKKFGEGRVVDAQPGKVVVRFGSEERIFIPDLAPITKL